MHKSKITIMVGPSGAGKTTIVNKMLQNNINLIRINRDDIRRVINGPLKDYYKQLNLRDKENIVSTIERSIIQSIENSNKEGNEFDIVIDNTNSNFKYLQQLIHELEGYEIEFHVVVPHYPKGDINTEIHEHNKKICKKRVMERDCLQESEVTYIDNMYRGFKDCLWFIESLPNDIIITETNKLNS